MGDIQRHKETSGCDSEKYRVVMWKDPEDETNMEFYILCMECYKLIGRLP